MHLAHLSRFLVAPVFHRLQLFSLFSFRLISRSFLLSLPLLVSNCILHIYPRSHVSNVHLTSIPVLSVDRHIVPSCNYQLAIVATLFFPFSRVCSKKETEEWEGGGGDATQNGNGQKRGNTFPGRMLARAHTHTARETWAHKIDREMKNKRIATPRSNFSIISFLFLFSFSAFCFLRLPFPIPVPALNGFSYCNKLEKRNDGLWGSFLTSSEESGLSPFLLRILLALFWPMPPSMYGCEGRGEVLNAHT